MKELLFCCGRGDSALAIVADDAEHAAEQWAELKAVRPPSAQVEVRPLDEVTQQWGEGVLYTVRVRQSTTYSAAPARIAFALAGGIFDRGPVSATSSPELTIFPVDELAAQAGAHS